MQGNQGQEPPSPEKEGEERIPKPRKTNRELGKTLSLRKTLKDEKPDFARQESWRYKRLKPSWRKPKGIDSKMRLGKKGWPKSVEVGYRSQKSVRGLHPSGFEEVVVYKVKDLEGINPNQAVRIAHTVGRRERAKIIEKAEETKILILNKRARAVETF